MSRLFRSILLPLLLAPSVSMAQTPDSLVKGQRIRVVSRCEVAGDQVPTCGASSQRWTYTGQLEALDPDKLRIRAQSTKADLVIATASIASLSVAHGTKGHFWVGAGIGLIGGAVIGGISGSRTNFFFCQALGGSCPMTGFGVIFGAAGGFVLGGVTGALIRSDRWRVVSINNQHVRATPRLDTRGLGLTVTVPF